MREKKNFQTLTRPLHTGHQYCPLCRTHGAPGVTVLYLGHQYCPLCSSVCVPRTKRRKKSGTTTNDLSMRRFLYIVFTLFMNLEHEVSTSNGANFCRTRNNIYLLQDEFNLESCISCYKFMSKYSFKTKSPLDSSTLKILRENNSDYENLMQNEVILNSFVSPSAAEKWKFCCKNASTCCSSMLANKTQKVNNWCPRTWDGWLCWPDVPPGNVEQKLCPSYALANVEKCAHSYALKTCDENGKWGLHPVEKNNEWTNYTPCSAKILIEKRMYVSIGSYAMSVIALVPALIIFQTFRSLRCHRIILHKNLFASLLLHCSTQIAFNAEYILDDLSGNSRISKNEVGCKVLLIFTKYFRLTNYLWMFCEGFYLHRQIVNVFAEETSLKMFYAIGWGFPVLPVIIFIAFRKTMNDSDCWALPSEYIDWALHLPCLLSLMINTIFLINIVTVLIMKLRSGHLNEHLQFRKAVKATFVLVPLFGIHFLFTLYRQESVCSPAEEGYAHMGSIFDGLQGFLVAIIFCYINSEVITVMKRFVRNMRDKHSLTHFAQSTCNGTLTTEVSSQTAL